MTVKEMEADRLLPGSLFAQTGAMDILGQQEALSKMINGFFAIYYTGVGGSGIGVIAIRDGVIVGADMTGGRYDGTYSENPGTGNFDAKIRMSYLPGTSLVTGALAGPQPLHLDMTTTLPVDLGSEKPLRLDTPTGPINVIFRKLREFP